MSTSTQSTYSSIVSAPSKDQAIILDSIEGCTIDDYLDGIEKITDLTNVRFISKISGNRVCIYLNSANLVNKLVSEKVIVNLNVLSIRPYIEKNKRIVISNVSPHIPHEVISQSLASKGISIVSQIHHMKASSSKPGRAHIMSFRRQAYIKEEDVHLLPDSLQIIHDETTHWIFLSTESANCFLCKQQGHIAKVCPSVQTATQNNFPLQPLSPAIESGLKRQAPPSSSDNLETLSQHTDDTRTSRIDAFKKPDAKKIKPNNASSSETRPRSADNFSLIGDSLAEVKTALESGNISTKKFPLDFEKFTRFLNETYGKSKITDIAASFTDNMEGLIDMLDITYPLITERRLKARIARIKKKIQKTSNSSSETDSDV